MAFFNYKLTDYTLDTMVVPTASLQKTRRRLWSYSLQVKSTEHTPKTRLIFTTIYLISVRFISEPRPIGSSVGHDGRFSRVPLPVVSADCPCEQFWHGQGCQLFDVVHPALPLLTTALPTLQGAQWFWRGCRVVWHAQTMQASVSWQLPEEVPVDPQGR